MAEIPHRAWVIYDDDCDPLEPSFETYQEAFTEAWRLAHKYPRSRFRIIPQCGGSVVVSKRFLRRTAEAEERGDDA